MFVAPRAVIFDFYGTLTSGATLAERDAARAAVAAALRCDPVAFTELVRSSFGDRASGRTGDALATMRWLAAGCGIEISDADARRAYELRLAVEWPFMQPRAETIDVLAALKSAGVRIGVLSDCAHELPQCWPRLPYRSFVDAAVFSVETGTRKPDRAMYEAVCERLGVDASNCLYVGDGGSNELTGATAAGLRAIQVCGPEFDDCHTYDAEIGWEGPVITDLREVLSIAGIAVADAAQRVRRTGTT